MTALPSQVLMSLGRQTFIFKMKTLIPFFFIFSIIVLGCSSTPEPSAEAIKADNPEKAALTEKLDAMTPEQRAAYVQANQAEIQQTYSGVNNGQASGR